MFDGLRREGRRQGRSGRRGLIVNESRCVVAWPNGLRARFAICDTWHAGGPAELHNYPKIGNRREDSLECHVLFSESPNVLVVLLDDVGKDDFSRLIEPEDRLSVVMTRQ